MTNLPLNWIGPVIALTAYSIYRLTKIDIPLKLKVVWSFIIIFLPLAGAIASIFLIRYRFIKTVDVPVSLYLTDTIAVMASAILVGVVLGLPLSFVAKVYNWLPESHIYIFYRIIPLVTFAIVSLNWNKLLARLDCGDIRYLKQTTLRNKTKRANDKRMRRKRRKRKK